MKKIKKKVRKHFENQDDPIIDTLSRQDLEYIDGYMDNPNSVDKIRLLEVDSEKLVINPGDDNGITYFRKP